MAPKSGNMSKLKVVTSTIGENLPDIVCFLFALFLIIQSHEYFFALTVGYRVIIGWGWPREELRRGWNDHQAQWQQHPRQGRHHIPGSWRNSSSSPPTVISSAISQPSDGAPLRTQKLPNAVSNPSDGASASTQKLPSSGSRASSHSSRLQQLYHEIPKQGNTESHGTKRQGGLKSVPETQPSKRPMLSGPPSPDPNPVPHPSPNPAPNPSNTNSSDSSDSEDENHPQQGSLAGRARRLRSATFSSQSWNLSRRRAQVPANAQANETVDKGEYGNVLNSFPHKFTSLLTGFTPNLHWPFSQPAVVQPAGDPMDVSYPIDDDLAEDLAKMTIEDPKEIDEDLAQDLARMALQDPKETVEYVTEALAGLELEEPNPDAMVVEPTQAVVISGPMNLVEEYEGENEEVSSQRSATNSRSSSSPPPENETDDNSEQQSQSLLPSDEQDDDQSSTGGNEGNLNPGGEDDSSEWLTVEDDSDDDAEPQAPGAQNTDNNEDGNDESETGTAVYESGNSNDPDVTMTEASLAAEDENEGEDQENDQDADDDNNSETGTTIYDPEPVDDPDVTMTEAGEDVEDVEDTGSEAAESTESQSAGSSSGKQSTDDGYQADESGNGDTSSEDD